MDPERQRARALAAAVREACWEAAATAIRDAGMSGLCAEGQLEMALGAVRAVDLEEVISQYRASLGVELQLDGRSESPPE